MQEKQSEWAWQWDRFYDDNEWLFTEWIFPNKLEDLRGRSVLDCGCGGGGHINFVAPYAERVLGVDLNALSSARDHTRQLANVELREDDIAAMDLGERFDTVYSIGVLHHTDDPERSFRNIARHCKVGGRTIVWVYSREGNFLNRTLVEGSKKLLLRLPRQVSWALSHVLTVLINIPVFTVYRLPLRFLPYYEYFENWRVLGYRRNVLNVFDKLNAPKTWFIRKAEIERWFRREEFTDVHISPYKGVSWRGSGTRQAFPEDD
jgi:SAM-dependent methyltransferase